jgi:hypothetical protein
VIIFPWLVLLLALALLAQLILVLPEASRSLYREHRIRAHRPTFRAILVLTLLELGLLLVWGIFVVADKAE